MLVAPQRHQHQPGMPGFLLSLAPPPPALQAGICYQLRACITASELLPIDMGAGCQRTVYVCDDGKDKFKRRMCQRMGREVTAAPLPHHSPLRPHPIDACLLACQSMCRLDFPRHV